MELSRELFKLIIAQLKGIGGGHDKRKSPRVGLRNHVQMMPLKSADVKPTQSCNVIVRDLSPDGIGILHHRRINADSFFAIRLPASEAVHMVAVYKVKHCETLEENLFRIGGILIKVNDPIPVEPDADIAPPAKAPVTPAETNPAAPSRAAAH
jgi:hypothetical protein